MKLLISILVMSLTGCATHNSLDWHPAIQPASTSHGPNVGVGCTVPPKSWNNRFNGIQVCGNPDSQ